MKRELILALVAALLSALSVAGLRFSRRASSGSWLDSSPVRPLEARLCHPAADRHRPYASSESAPEPLPLRELAQLEQQEDWRSLSAALLLRADGSQAALFLAREPASPARDNDLAVLALTQGRYDEALELLEGILDAHPAHPQALWNRGLVLRELGLPLVSAASFEAVAALGEPGWSEEARQLATALREPMLARHQAWKAARDATLALIDDPGAPLPLEGAQRFPGIVRENFYDVVRAAPSREQALALLPLADALDRHSGGTVLRDYIHRVAARDFSRRAPLARDYALLARGKHPSPQLFAEQLLTSGEEDMAFGALMHASIAPQHLEALSALARGTGDPWLIFLAEQERALQEGWEQPGPRAERSFQSLLRTCEGATFLHPCLAAQRAVASFYTDTNRLAEATEYVRKGQEWAKRREEWEQERRYLNAIAQIARFQVRLFEGQAYLKESLARGLETCEQRNYLYRNLASFAFRRFRIDEARQELDEAFACGMPASLHGAWLLADISRIAPRPEDAQRLQHVLKELARMEGTSGRQQLVHLIKGRDLIERDREAGRALLHRVVAEASRLPRTDINARDARAYGYSTLATVAGLDGDFLDALKVVAEALEISAPQRCALAAAVDTERTVVVALGPGGEPLGFFDASRRRPLEREDSPLIPPSLVERLRGCERVDVLALPPVDSHPELLPPDLAWSYRALRTAPRPHAPLAPLHLLVADVETPPGLMLPRLPAWSSTLSTPEPRITLSGTEATPSRVRAALRSATEIEIHAHGLVDPGISIASLIVLAPEGDGRYALTADEVRELEFAGEPVVLLAACSAARTAPFLHESFTLPQAFIGAGARAVFAAAVDIPDSAGRFFSALRERIRSGASPAVALREERIRWLQQEPEAGWVRGVLLYE